MENRDFSKLKKGPHYKFLRRSLCFDGGNEDSIKKLTIYTKTKRLYFRKINEEESSEEFSTRHYYSKGKQLNCLTHLVLALSRESHDKKLVKQLKNLKDIYISLHEDGSLKLISQFIKTLPKNIERIIISACLQDTNVAEIQDLYRSLSICRKLKRLEKRLNYGEEEQDNTNWTEIEYEAINKYFLRLRNLKQLNCTETRDEEQILRKFMSKGVTCPFVTGLSMLQSTLGNDNLDDDNDDYEIQENNIPALFRLQLFPNLRQLKITTYKGEISLDSSIIQGFKSLVQLEHFNLFIFKISTGKEFLFQGLHHLPLLSLFNLSVLDVGNEEGSLLVEFLRKQTQLVSLSITLRGSLSSREKYEDQNRYLEMICQNLNDKVKLKYLCLDTTPCSLRSLSRGLSRAGIANQLKEFKIRVFDDISVTSVTPYSKVEGLCEFIKNQKLSLTSLSLFILSVKEDEVIDSLVKAISETDKLQFLDVTLNNMHVINALQQNKLLQEIPRESLQGYPLYNKTFVYLNQTLQRLKHLSNLSLSLYPLLFPFDAPIINSSVVISALPSLKKLRYLWLDLPFLKQSVMNNPAQVLLLTEIKSLSETVIRTSSDDLDEIERDIEEVEKALEPTKQQRYVKLNLTF